MIGRTRISNKSNKFQFTLVSGSSTYIFDNKSISSSVSNVYSFVRESKENWYLILYATGNVTFDSLNSKLDICGVGGGAGGGGGRAFGSGYGGSGKWGGSGGGGYYQETLGISLIQGVTYTCTIGAGGSGGGGGYSSGTSGSGARGGTTSVVGNEETIISANGGYGGGGASSANYTAGSGSGGSAQYCFDGTTDNGYPYVSGVGSRRGGGGGGGGYNSNLYGDWSANRGGSGTAGLVIIRNFRDGAALTVYAPAKSIVTISKDTTILRREGFEYAGNPELYEYDFKIKGFDSENPWVITSTRGEETATDTIIIASALNFTKTLYYPRYLFKNGIGPQEILGVRLQSTAVGATINNSAITQALTNPTVTGSTVAAIYTIDTIDVTNYKYLVFDSLNTKIFASADYKVMYVVSTNLNTIAVTGKASTVNQTAKFVPSNTTERQIDVINISSISGSYYIGTWGAGEFQIYNIYLTNDLPETT